MMPALQYLRHGKALCGKVFKRFVETFNYHNDFIANLKGDGDLPVSDGLINVDLTDPRHPVIRLNKQKLKGGTACEHLPGCWQYVPPTETESGTFKFPYFIVGARLYRAKDEEIAFADAFEDCIVCVDVDLTGAAPAVEIKTPEDFSGVQTLQAVDGHSVHPLYQFEGGKIVCDFRNIPNMGAWEFQE